ncbi:MAG TPA: ABC transporter ATP-binding protein [Coxiellaceae bacterium]|nr:ABC transporter ATP-binding protein [Coxiellaceae bacterium]
MSSIIQVSDLSKSFDHKTVVNHIALTVNRGDIFGFLGPNGSGKTTTIRMLCGLLTPDSGSGQCLGFDIIKDAESIKKKVGYMTQHFSLYEDLTIEENLDFVARLYNINNRKEKIESVLRELNLQDRRKQLTETLSGGWKQRLALSAALLHDPALLLLDEPTAGVDPKARREFWDKIHALSQQGVTTLVSTHYMDEAARCNRLTYISRGNLLTQGSSKDIIRNSGLTTWEVENLQYDVSLQLKKLPGVDFVVAFGDVWHISGYDAASLEKSIASVKTEQQRWTQIIPGLEDVFIALQGKTT